MIGKCSPAFHRGCGVVLDDERNLILRVPLMPEDLLIRREGITFTRGWLSDETIEFIDGGRQAKFVWRKPSGEYLFTRVD